jgi:hypothetical protein
MRIIVRKAFFKRKRLSVPEEGIMIERIAGKQDTDHDPDLYIYEDDKYFPRLKKLKNPPAYTVKSNQLVEFVIPEEFTKVKCIKALSIKDTKRNPIIVAVEKTGHARSVLKGEQKLEEFHAKNTFYEGYNYYITMANNNAVTIIDHFLKEATFLRNDPALEHFQFSII